MPDSVRTNCRLRRTFRTQKLASRASACVNDLRNRPGLSARHPPLSRSRPCRRSSTRRAIPVGASCSRSCANTSRRSGRRPPICATARACRVFVEEEFEAFLRCGWLAGGSPGSGAATAAWIDSRIFLQGARLLRQLRRAPHDRAGRAPGGPGVPRCPRTAVGAEPAPEDPVSVGLAPRPVQGLVGVLLREVNRHLRDRARARGLVDPRGGAVAVVQRFGGALNLNVHIHALVLDGVFARALTSGIL